jgi:hypothetical protein
MRFSELITIRLNAASGQAIVVPTGVDHLIGKDPLWVADVLGDVLEGLIRIYNEAALRTIEHYGFEKSVANYEVWPVILGLDRSKLSGEQQQIYDRFIEIMSEHRVSLIQGEDRNVIPFVRRSNKSGEKDDE